MTHFDPIERELVVLAANGDRVALDRILVRNFDRIVNHITPRLPLEERNYGRDIVVVEFVRVSVFRVAVADSDVFIEVAETEGNRRFLPAFTFRLPVRENEPSSSHHGNLLNRSDQSAPAGAIPHRKTTSGVFLW